MSDQIDRKPFFDLIQKMESGEPWTNDDLNVLIDAYLMELPIPRNEIGNRSRESVRNRVWKLTIGYNELDRNYAPRNRQSRTGSPWTSRDHKLMAHYQKWQNKRHQQWPDNWSLTIEHLAKVMMRSISDIENHLKNRVQRKGFFK